MKLYTEEQVNKIALQVKDFGFWNHLEITPIELPSDDEIEELSRQINYGGGSMGWIKDAFKKGAISVINKIKNQQ